MTKENDNTGHTKTAKACAVNFKDVTFSYNGKDRAVDNVTMCIHRSQSIGLLGHNGAGKTTTLRLVLGLLRPQQGSIEVNGFAPTSPHVPRSMISYMPEVGGIYERLTGFQNLEFRARAANVDPATIHAKSEFWLERLGLLKRGEEKAGYWSKGMKQRLSLACALICRPQLLLLDEPTNGLDPESLSIVTQILQDIYHAQGTTLIISSHDLNSVRKICDHMVILQFGKLIHTGAVENTTELLQETYLKLTAER